MPKYHNIETIPAKVFFDILKTKNYQLLKPKPSEQGLEEIFVEIYDEYYLKSENPKAKEFLELKNNVLIIQAKISVITKTLLFLYNTELTKETFEETLSNLSQIGIFINKSNGKLDEIDRILSIEIGILKNDLNFYLMELESLESTSSKDVFDFYESLVSLENIHERTLEEKLSLAKYIQYEKLAKRKIEMQKQSKIK